VAYDNREADDPVWLTAYRWPELFAHQAGDRESHRQLDHRTHPPRRQQVLPARRFVIEDWNDHDHFRVVVCTPRRTPSALVLNRGCLWWVTGES
jgi:hypothetical protein